MRTHRWKLALAIVGVVGASAGVVSAQLIQQAASRPMRATPQPTTPAASPSDMSTPAAVTAEICRQSCEGSVATAAFSIHSLSGTVTCPVNAQLVIPCAPYACNARARTCQARCVAASDCAPGFTCAGTACVPRPTSSAAGSQVQDLQRPHGAPQGGQNEELRRPH